MKASQIIAVSAALVGSSLAAPYKRQQQYSVTDADILNYALTLEHLEDKFYREGLANFTAADFAAAGYDQSFYENLVEISFDEGTHVGVLTSALQAAGATPVQECTYDFPVADVASFVATAAVLEGVGVTAYLGAAANISNKQYLTIAGSILTIEARHNAYLRAALKQRPAPQTFDAPQDFNMVFSLAAPMIVACPADNAAFIPLKAFPALSITSDANATIVTNSTIEVSAVLANASAPVFASFVSVTGPVAATIAPCGTAPGSFTVTIPAGVHGQSYLLLTSDPAVVSDDTVVAGPAIVMIAGTNGAPTVL